MTKNAAFFDKTNLDAIALGGTIEEIYKIVVECTNGRNFKKPYREGRRIMKTTKSIWYIVIVILLSALVLAACAQATPTPTEEAPPPPVEETEEPVAPPEEVEAPFPAPPGGFLEKALAGEYAGTTVNVMGVMVDEEAVKFEKSMEPFEEATGIDFVYEGTREFETAINVRIDAGDPPDIANFSQPGLVANLARAGELTDVRDFIAEDWLQQQYNQAWLDMATMEGPDGEDMLTGVWHRTAGKSFVWYPKVPFEEAGYEIPTTWEEMVALTQQIADDGDTAWCIGIESGAATGWVATDWMENIMLRTTSTDNYDKWVTHELPFNSPEVKNAAETMAEIWLNEDFVYGGPSGIVSIYIGDSPVPMFEDPPACWFHAQAPWIQGFFGEGLEAGVDYDFFTLPPLDPAYGTPVLVAGDEMIMFNDRPEVKALMEHFATGAGVEGWVKAGGPISPHNDSSLDWYTNDIDRAVAKAILDAETVRFDASDLMPSEVGAGSFWKAMTDWISGSVDLDTALQEVDDSWPQ
jgi:alpha-glucoside transport system substrate-binding protein